MRMAVCMEWVADPEYPLRPGPEGMVWSPGEVPRVPNPADLVACEAAIRLREEAGGEVAVFSVGPPDAERVLREGLALGADTATLVVFEPPPFGGTGAARLLAHVLARDGMPDLVLCGARSAASGRGATPAALARYLELPIVCDVLRIAPSGPREVEVERRRDGGRREVLRLDLPGVVSVEPSLCQPRYPTLPARRRAQAAPVASCNAADLGAPAPEPALKLVALRPPRPKAALLAAPPSGLDARQRMRFILAGGPDQRRSSRRLQGTTTEMVAGLVDFLRANGFGARPRE